MKRYWQHLLFLLLCIIVPSTFACFGLLYQQYYDFQYHTTTIGCLILGGLASSFLVGWCIWSFREHKVRAAIGLFVCLATFLWTYWFLWYIETSKMQVG